MLPSQGELELDYVHRLHTVQVVDESALAQRDERARRALDIVEDAARTENAKEAKPADAPKGITEEAIAEKVKAGLRREQAIEVLQSQAAHDAALAAAEKNKGKA